MTLLDAILCVVVLGAVIISIVSIAVDVSIIKENTKNIALSLGKIRTILQEESLRSRNDN